MKLLAYVPRVLVLLMVLFFSCRKEYNPPAIEGNNHFLSADGFINTGPGTVTTFKITRSLNLNDTIPTLPELGAQVSIMASDGSSHALSDVDNKGVYASETLQLDSSLNFQLSISTADGNKYISDFVLSKSAPPIDSISWQEIDDPVTGQKALNVYANAHDPQNNTLYYRWDFDETYKHLAHYDTHWGVKDGYLYPFTDSTGNYRCWTTDHSSSILLASSVALAKDVISQAPIAGYAQNDPKLDLGISLLVRQYPLTQDAYKYWLTVQKNSQSLGGLFDLQPSQIRGNLHCTTNPDNPALGYISASSVQEMRVYISNSRLTGWKSNPSISCPESTIIPPILNDLLYEYPDTAYGPWKFVGSNPAVLYVTTKNCIDCRYQGGTNIKPSFWPAQD